MRGPSARKVFGPGTPNAPCHLPAFAQQVLNTNLFKIDMAAVQKITKSEFIDVNKYFDSIGKKRP